MLYSDSLSLTTNPLAWPESQERRSDTKTLHKHGRMSIDTRMKVRDQVVSLASRSVKGEKVFESLKAALQCWGMGLGDSQAKLGGSSMG